MKENIDMLIWDSSECLRGAGAGVTPPAVGLPPTRCQGSRGPGLGPLQEEAPSLSMRLPFFCGVRQTQGKSCLCQNSGCVTLGMLFSVGVGCDLLG